jgi:opacity protein-like surface antigen
MKKNTNYIFLTAVISAGLFSSAMAADASRSAANNFYGKVEAGAAILSNLGNQNFPNANVNAGPAFGVEAGYRVHEKIRLGMNFGYQKNNMPSYRTNEPLANANGSAPINNEFKLGNLSSMNTMFNVYYDLLEYDGFTPYATLGFGLAKNKIGTSSVSYESTQNLRTGRAVSASGLCDYKKASKTNFALNVGFGALYEITPKVSLDMGYRYKNLGKVATKSDNEGLELYNLAKEYTVKLNSHNVAFGLIYNF